MPSIIITHNIPEVFKILSNSATETPGIAFAGFIGEMKLAEIAPTTAEDRTRNDLLLSLSLLDIIFNVVPLGVDIVGVTVTNAELDATLIAARADSSRNFMVD